MNFMGLLRTMIVWSLQIALNEQKKAWSSFNEVYKYSIALRMMFNNTRGNHRRDRNDEWNVKAIQSSWSQLPQPSSITLLSISNNHKFTPWTRGPRTLLFYRRTPKGHL